MNGFVRNGKNEFFMWIGKRSDNKQTWPGKLDNTVSLSLYSFMLCCSVQFARLCILRAIIKS